MTITVPKLEKCVTFGDLEIGDMFIYEGEVYIKIASVNHPSISWCAISLTTRGYEDFSDGTTIYQIVKNIIVEL